MTWLIIPSAALSALKVAEVTVTLSASFPALRSVVVNHAASRSFRVGSAAT
jgi:hypothetical protein